MTGGEGLENARLRVFRTVAETLNFRAAAEQLLLTQPAVSQGVRALEEEVGAALFDRTGGRVRLTAAGEALLPYADAMRRQAAEARAAVAGVTGAVRGRVLVGASQTIGQYLLPRLIAGFLREHAEVEFAVRNGNTQQVMEALRAGRLEVALIEGPAMGTDVRVEAFLEDHMVCVVAPGHAWAAGEAVPVEAVRGETVLLREVGSGSRRTVEEAMEAAGLEVRELRLGPVFDSTEGVLSGVEAGLGVAWVSRWAVRHQVALGTLRIARVRGMRVRRQFQMAWAGGPEPAGVAGAFCRFVRERGEELAPRGLRRRTRETTAG